MNKHLVALTVGSLLSMTTSAVLADDPLPKQISLNDRVFLGTTTIYDPVYGLYKIGFVRKNVMHWLAPNKPLPKFAPPKVEYLNFPVYSFHSDEGYSGNVSIPVIGLAGSASSSKSVYASMEDISDVSAPNPGLSECAIWSYFPKNQIEPGDTVVLTDHATFSRVSYGSGTKQDAKATAGIGGYFGIGADIYKQDGADTKFPLIAVDGFFFKVSDPRTFCTSHELAVRLPRHFNSASQLGSPNLSVQREAGDAARARANAQANTGRAR